ncbi:hypothetical protein [Salinibacter ruber]|uniref:hypothetical protein n=1 Tax=Salinibacter ruber TaxID=146919 RepID=UPI002072DA69|nr:hypothetical protein [Salinibacter ruber]
MDKSDITSALKRNGFVFTDVETPGGTVRITARGPNCEVAVIIEAVVGFLSALPAGR